MEQIIGNLIGQEVRQISKTRLKSVKVKQAKRNIWIEVIEETKWLSWEKVKSDYEECSELLAIFTSIGKK